MLFTLLQILLLEQCGEEEGSLLISHCCEGVLVSVDRVAGDTDLVGGLRLVVPADRIDVRSRCFTRQRIF